MRIEIEVDIPKGWKAVAYRCAKKGEWFLNDANEAVRAERDGMFAWIILEKEKPVRRVFEFTGEVRKVCEGEYYNNESGIMCCHRISGKTVHEYEIWKEVTEEENES